MILREGKLFVVTSVFSLYHVLW